MCERGWCGVQVEIQIPHAFRAMELAPEARSAAGTALPLPEELEALDLKALSCAPSSPLSTQCLAL